MPDFTQWDLADSAVAQFEEMTRKAGQVQEEVLHAILERNACTEYLRSCGLHGRTDAGTFKKLVPIVSHSDLKPYFDRIAQGDRSPILTADPVQTLSLSSGTTSGGQQKYLVLYKEILEASGLFARISGAYRARAIPIRAGGRMMELVFSGKLSKTSSGLTCATATTHLFQSKQFKQKPGLVKPCSPEEVVRASDQREAMYCHLLCALLLADDVEYVFASFAYTVVEVLRTFEQQWRSLCHDIRLGQLSPCAVREPALRAAMARVLSGLPDPALADRLALTCEALATHGWRDLIPAIWPNCKYILSIMTGSMTSYLTRLRHYAGDLPLVSSDYGSTESWIGVNANPKAEPNDVTYTIVPSVAYYEFLPLAGNDEHGGHESDLEPVGMTEVEVGKEYELLLTTYGGLYRYKLGDVVRITGFFNSSPQLAYVCRKNVLLTVHIDKNTEKDLQVAVDKGVEVLEQSVLADGAERQQQGHMRVDLVDYTSYADLSSTPGHYVVFWELGSSTNADAAEVVLQKCASAMDAAFVDPGYVGSRKVGTIGPLELCLVRPGTFRLLLERYMSSCGAAITQYKTPRCTTSDEQRRILRRSVCTTVFSSAYQLSR